MMADLRGRILVLILFTELVLIAGSTGQAAAQERTPIPEYTGDRVYIKDVPGSYQSLNETIKQLERSSPQSYFVVVVRSAGPGPDSATRYVEELSDTWSNQARAKALKLDPERSVITLVAIGDKRVAVHTGSFLREHARLQKGTVEALIDQAFIPLALKGKYPEGIASLLARIEDHVAKQDTTVTAPGKNSLVAPTETGKPAARVAVPAGKEEATQAGIQNQMLLALVASLIAVGLIVAALIWLARHRTRNTVESKIKQYKKNAVDVMDRLDALKARLKKLPVEDPDFKEPISGETLAVYQKIEGNLTGLWDRWLEVMDALDKAQALAKKDSALGTEKLKEAEKLVSDSKVFEQIEVEAQKCAASMDELNQAHENARSAAEVVVVSQKEILTGVEKVEKEGLPSVPYKPEIDGIAAQASQAKEILTPDPIGARHSLDKAQERAVALRDRVHQILDRYADGRRISAALTTLGQQVADQRKSGLRLDEEGGNPHHPIGQTFQQLEALRKAVHEGDPQAALEHLQAAQALLDQSQQTLDGVLKAKDLCEQGQPERVGETQRLREALGQYEAFETELKRSFATTSWQAVAGNLAQARTLLGTFVRKAQEVAAAASQQKYLLGARLLGQLTLEQQAVFQLMSGVGDQLSALKALREECQNGVRGLEERAHATNRYFSQNSQVTGAMARGTLASAEQSRQQLESLLNQSLPDWPKVRQVLARALEESAIAQNQAETDVRLYQELSATFDRVRQDASRVQAFLAGHEEDRLAANQHYQAAENALSQVQSESAGSGGEWARLLEQVRGAAADLAHSERLAQEDVRLARQAETEIQEAVRTLRKARAYFSMGVTLNTQGAEGQVSQAEQAYRSQNYEQAIRTASAAIQQVRQAHTVAVQQAFWRQMQVDAERRRYSAATRPGIGLGSAAAAAAAGAVILDAMTPSSRGLSAAAAPPSSNLAPTQPEPSTASGSWSSETAERGW
jgi:TPM domain